MQQAKSRYRSGPFSWKAGLLFLLTGGFLIGYFRHERARAERERIAAAGKAGVGVGKPRIGGPFVLTDMFGKRVTEEEFKERYTLVSWPKFVFCFCFVSACREREKGWDCKTGEGWIGKG